MKILGALSTLWFVGSVTAVSLWPMPESVTEGNDAVWMHRDVAVEINLPKDPAPEEADFIQPSITSEKIENAWKRAKTMLFKDNIVPWKFHPKGTAYEPKFNDRGSIRKVVVTQRKADRIRVSYEDMNEEYTLSMPNAEGEFLDQADARKQGVIYIDAETSNGVLHGLTTLTQLFYAAGHWSAFGNVYSPQAPVLIKDKPKFKHRGLNLDVARQWYPVDVIKRMIDALSWNKFNRLHLHVTDSQSWPLEIPALPELAEKGAYAPGLTYSPRDIQDLLDYAEQRGIEVIMEIDMPGHTTSIADAYPDLIVGKNMQPNWDTYAAQPPSGSLKLNNQAVEDFLTKLFGDLLPRLRTHSRYFHTGGDEVNKNVYALDPGVGSNQTEVIQPHLQKFFDHVQSQVQRYQTTSIVWEEMLLDWNLNVPKDTIIQTWQTDEATYNATEKGYKIIAGNYNYWYLDCGQGQWLDFHQGESFQKFYPFADYCSPRKSWRLIYSYDPIQGLTPEQAKLVLGGEVHIWSEQIDGSSLDIIAWPRASAAAEVLWSGRTDAEGKNRTFEDASQRLGVMRERIVARGVQASPVTQLWCHQNPGDCAL